MNRTRPRLSEILPQLIAVRPGIDSSPRTVALRALVRGLAAAHSPASVRAFLSHRPDLVDVVSNDGIWRSLVTEARRWRKESTPDPVRLTIARRLVARVVGPMPPDVSPRMAVQLRIAYATIAMRALSLDHDHPLETVMVAGSWLGGLTNRTELIAARQLRMLRDIGWLRLVGRKNGTNTFRLTRLTSAERDAAWANADTVAALAENRVEDEYLATIISSVTAPAWHYSEGRLGAGRAWVRLVGQHAHPVKGSALLGLTQTSWRRLGRELEQELRGVLHGTVDLQAALDEYGEKNLGTFIAIDRQRDLAETAAANRARLQAFRAQRDDEHRARRILRAIVGAAGPPPVASDRRGIEAWTTRAGGVLAGRSLGDVDAFRLQLAEMLRRDGWPSDVVEKVVDFLAAAPQRVGS